MAEASYQLVKQFSGLCDCFADGVPAAGWLLNINGDRFTRDPQTTLAEGDCLLLMPADAGG